MVKVRQADANWDIGSSMSELEHDCYISSCQSCTHIVRGYEAVARHMQRTGTILDEQTSAASAGALESLKRHCDLLSSFKVYAVRD